VIGSVFNLAGPDILILLVIGLLLCGVPLGIGLLLYFLLRKKDQDK